MRKLFALLIAISAVFMFGCKAKTPATASSSSSDLDIQVIAPVSSDTSSTMDSSVASSSSSSKPASSQPKAIAPANSSHAANSSSPASPIANNDKQIAEENARHTAALKSLEDAYNDNVKTLDTWDSNQSLLEKGNDTNNKLDTYRSTVIECRYKIIRVLYPDTTYTPKLVVPPTNILRTKLKEQYNANVATENNKHIQIISKLN